MPLYAVIGFDVPEGHRLREQVRPAHREYVLASDGDLRLAGAFYDDAGLQCGTLLIFEAQCAADVWAWCRRETFYASGVYRDYHVIEWRMALNRLPDTNGWQVAPPRPAE
jgi:uncharacterized protein YciI